MFPSPIHSAHTARKLHTKNTRLALLSSSSSSSSSEKKVEVSFDQPTSWDSIGTQHPKTTHILILRIRSCKRILSVLEISIHVTILYRKNKTRALSIDRTEGLEKGTLEESIESDKTQHGETSTPERREAPRAPRHTKKTRETKQSTSIHLHQYNI